MKRLLLICGLALVVIPAALAGSPSSTATVTSSANPIVLDAAFTWSGCGYQPGQELRLQTSGLTTSGEYEFADAQGCFISSAWLLPSLYYGPGTETATVYKVTAIGGKPQKALASISVQVVAAS